jgi:transposase
VQPVSGRPTTLVWLRRRFICDRCGATTSERHGQFGHRVTNRMAAALFVEVTRSTVNAVREAHGLGWHLVMGIVQARVAILAARRRVRYCRVLCIDEKRLTKGHGPFSTILTDGDTGTVIGVIEGRSGATLEDWLAGRRVVTVSTPPRSPSCPPCSASTRASPRRGSSPSGSTGSGKQLIWTPHSPTRTTASAVP